MHVLSHFVFVITLWGIANITSILQMKGLRQSEMYSFAQGHGVINGRVGTSQSYARISAGHCMDLHGSPVVNAEAARSLWFWKCGLWTTSSEPPKGIHVPGSYPRPLNPRSLRIWVWKCESWLNFFTCPPHTLFLLDSDVQWCWRTTSIRIFIEVD